MCGIAGLLDQNISREMLESKGKAMLQTLVHRGPDAGEHWSSETHNLLLAHRRLAIQDLSDSGSQPMHSASQRYCVVFNGEIYNFREIASDLNQHGHQFIGHSDTEVLLAAIEEWGLQAAVQKFIGMFAFALWDKRDAILHLCRDRLGEKPLYYGWQNKVFYFASELKAIEVCTETKQTINHEGLSNFLRYGYVPAPISIYQGLYKLPPGTILSLPVDVLVSQSGFSPVAGEANAYPRPYWSVLDSANKGLANPLKNENEAINELDQLLRTTIKRQLIADVKVGTFLSGGIDSSLVSAIAQHESSEKIKTYTIGFSEKEYDESAYAEKIAKHLGTDHLTMKVTPKDALEVVPKLAGIYDEPFADSSQIPAYLVSKLAKEHVTVCLSGDGGDELFAGYNRYQWTDYLWGRLSIMPDPLRRVAGKALAIPPPIFWDRLYQVATLYKSQKQSSAKLVGLKLQKLAGFMQQADIQQGYEYLLSFWSQPDQILVKQVVNNLIQPANQLEGNAGFIHQAMYTDQMAYLPGDNLVKVDRASMAVSLETRLPLLSHEVVDLSWRLPLSMKLQNNETKWALRQVLFRYVPRELIERPKMGFSVPIDSWLRGELKNWAEDLLATIDNVADDLLKKEVVLQTWHEHISGRRDHSHRLWTILMFLSWSNDHSI
jgi:asparagine synthase (glutamine-hydrolysing)